MKIVTFLVILMVSEIQSSCLETLKENFDVETYNGRFYLFSKTKAAWQNAENECVKNGGHLTSINNLDEDKFLVQQMGGRNMGWTWIGLNDLNVQGNYVWSDGSPVEYLKWASNEPSTVTERCVLYWSTEISFSAAQWNDSICEIERRFVCKV